MDKELFDLCQRVYKITNWQAKPWLNYTMWSEAPFELFDGVEPLYTSDYLLEKLPVEVPYSKYDMAGLTVYAYEMAKNKYWSAFYEMTEEYSQPSRIFDVEADTALKALLKLTLSLAEAGQLTKKEN